MSGNFLGCRSRQTHLNRRALPERRAAVGILPQLPAGVRRALGSTSKRSRGGTFREGRSQSQAPFGCRQTEGDAGESTG